MQNNEEMIDQIKRNNTITGELNIISIHNIVLERETTADPEKYYREIIIEYVCW